MADEEHQGGTSRRAPALGVVGALVAIASIWWFAFRPRRAHDDSGGPTSSQD